MSADIKKIDSRAEIYQQDAREVLEEALTLGFTSVIVIGQNPDRSITYKKSCSINTLELLGALEMAKYNVLETWK